MLTMKYGVNGTYQIILVLVDCLTFNCIVSLYIARLEHILNTRVGGAKIEDIGKYTRYFIESSQHE